MKDLHHGSRSSIKTNNQRQTHLARLRLPCHPHHHHHRHVMRIKEVLLSVLACDVSGVITVTAQQSPEDLFRQTVQRWRSSQTYQPWIDLDVEIAQRFEEAPQVTNPKQQQKPPPRLDLIGALEESILVIERSTLQEGVNRPRDAALSQLYGTYGNLLLRLSKVECHLLALDPHTLLIGADTVKTTSSTPSTQLCVENAENSLRNSVTLDATNSEAQKMLDHILQDGSGVHERKPKEFVAELFDSFAKTFDDKLLKGLQYKVPKLVGQAVMELSSSGNHHYKNALDAGCGTGLAGRFLRPVVSQKLIGVDASPKMLDIAAKCTLSSGCGLETTTPAKKDPQLYDGLLVMDLEAMTVANTLGDDNLQSAPGFDLIVAADVLVYFGSLDNLLQTFQQVSTKGAQLVVSCERTTQEEAPLGWRLLPSGRFAHTKQHVLEAGQKAGYHLKLYREIVPRMEKGEEVLGHLFGFELGPRPHHLEL